MRRFVAHGRPIPAIRDFIGLSENAWDFTKPETIAGFGPLLPVDDVKRLLSQILKDESDLLGSEDEPSQTALQQPETAEETTVSTTQIATSEQNFEGADSEPEPRR